MGLNQEVREARRQETERVSKHRRNETKQKATVRGKEKHRAGDRQEPLETSVSAYVCASRCVNAYVYDAQLVLRVLGCRRITFPDVSQIVTNELESGRREARNRDRSGKKQVPEE